MGTHNNLWRGFAGGYWLWHILASAGASWHLLPVWSTVCLPAGVYPLLAEIAVYGFAKILKTQFQTPDYRLDMPLGEMSGFGLTWYYFGYSYILAVIIASFQIGGAVLLLYRRTTLLATIILLPVMVNIVFINIFYDIDFGAFINSILFTLGLTYLLLLDTPKLKVSFWDLVEKLPAVHLRPFWAKHLLRLMPIAAAFGLICSYVYNDKSDKKLIGTWEVQRYFRNGKAVDTHSWITDTTVVARVYFAGRYGCAFSPNPYAYKWQQALRGEYEYNDTKHQLKFRYSTADSDKQDSLLATISNLTARSMVVEGILRKDTIRMELTKLERKRP